MKTTKELLESITKSKVARRNKLTGGNPKRDISSQEVKDQMAASVKATLDKFEQEKKAEAAKKIGVRKESTLEKAISNYRSINEGTWTLTSKDGIQKRFKDDKSQAAKDWVSGNQKKEKIMSAKVPKAAAVSLDTIWRKVEDVVGNIYPDGDPIDYLGPWCKKQGIDYSMVDKAAKKHGFKDVYAYWDSMSEHLG